MKRNVIAKIRQYFETIPVEKAWLFGSMARNTATDTSDIDLLIRFAQPNIIDLFDMAGYIVDLEEITQRKVDLVEEGYLKSFAEENVEREKKLIYEREAQRQRAHTAYH